MANESLIVRVPEDKVRYDKERKIYWVDLGDGDTFLRQILIGMASPNQAIVQKAKE